MTINLETIIYLTTKITKKHIRRKPKIIKKEINLSNKKQIKFINLVVRMNEQTKLG